MSEREADRLPVQVRTLREEDVAAVQAIAARVPTAPHWPGAEFLRMAQVVFERPHRRGAWVAMLPLRMDAVAGFAMAHKLADEVELESIVTAPEYRRHSVGAALLEQVLAWSRGLRAERLLLECRASNEDALRLYRRYGFVEDGRRRGYYRNPDEDAVLMSHR